MPGVFQINFLPNGPVVRVVGSSDNYYEFEDGSHLAMHSAPVWCRHCGKVTHAEDIESLAELDERIARMEAFDAERHERLSTFNDPASTVAFRGAGESLDNARKRRLWRERRWSGPRCIRCGSTDIAVFPYNRQIPSPCGAGTVEMKIIGICGTMSNERFFTPEGVRIPRDLKLTRHVMRTRR